MKRERPQTSSSLDMLLDTMCNTFGGVCFIALMVAIISVMMPRAENGDEDREGTEREARMLVERERQQLARRRDALKVALARQRDFIQSNAVQEVSVDLAKLSASISSNATEILKLKAERLELEDLLARKTTEVEYSRREAARLERLLRELDEQLGRAKSLRTRAVRTPNERQLQNLHHEDLWLRKGRLHLLRNGEQVDMRTWTDESGRRRWQFSAKPGTGYLVDESFFFGPDWERTKTILDERGYARIFSDLESYRQLCELRDALIHFGRMYNWYIRTGETLDFIAGYDGKVQ